MFNHIHSGYQKIERGIFNSIIYLQTFIVNDLEFPVFLIVYGFLFNNSILIVSELYIEACRTSY